MLSIGRSQIKSFDEIFNRLARLTEKRDETVNAFECRVHTFDELGIGGRVGRIHELAEKHRLDLVEQHLCVLRQTVDKRIHRLAEASFRASRIDQRLGVNVQFVDDLIL